jgi:hypothetical protein
MTTGTTLVEVKQAVVTLLAARPGLATAQVSYEYPLGGTTGKDIWLGRATADTRIPTVKAGTKKVDEEYILTIVAQFLETQGGGQEVADLGALALLREIQQAFAETPQLIPSIQWATVSGWVHNIGVFGHDDTGGDVNRGSRFEIQVTVRARLG